MTRLRPRREQHQRRRRDPRDLRAAPPLAEQHRRDHRANRRTERPLVALDRNPGKSCVGFVFFHFAEAVADDLLHFRRAVSERNVEAPARFRNFPHPRFVELRLHVLALIVAQELRPAAGRRNRNQRAIRRAEADRENVKAILVRPRGDHRIRLQLLAVGKNDQRAVLALAFSECLVRRLDRIREIRPAARDDVRVEFLQRVAHRAEVRRERRLQERRSGKRDQAHAVALDLIQQILGGELCAREPVRQEIRREHGFRGVDREDDVAPALPFLLPSEAPPRPCECDNGERDPDQQQRKSPASSRDAHAAREPRLQPRGDQLVECDAPHFLRVKNQQREQWQRGERPQEPRLREVEFVHLIESRKTGSYAKRRQIPESRGCACGEKVAPTIRRHRASGKDRCVEPRCAFGCVRVWTQAGTRTSRLWTSFLLPRPRADESSALHFCRPRDSRHGPPACLRQQRVQRRKHRARADEPRKKIPPVRLPFHLHLGFFQPVDLGKNLVQ